MALVDVTEPADQRRPSLPAGGRLRAGPRGPRPSPPSGSGDTSPAGRTRSSRSSPRRRAPRRCAASTSFAWSCSSSWSSGAVFVPLGLEAHWRHAQPEVGVIARAGELPEQGARTPTAPTTSTVTSSTRSGTAGLRVLLPVLPAHGRLRPALGRRRTRARDSPTRASS